MAAATRSSVPWRTLLLILLVGGVITAVGVALYPRHPTRAELLSDLVSEVDRDLQLPEGYELNWVHGPPESGHISMSLKSRHATDDRLTISVHASNEQARSEVAKSSPQSQNRVWSPRAGVVCTAIPTRGRRGDYGEVYCQTSTGRVSVEGWSRNLKPEITDFSNEERVNAALSLMDSGVSYAQALDQRRPNFSHSAPFSD